MSEEKKNDGRFISRKEAKRIARENIKITKQYEKAKARKNVPLSEYTTQMTDEGNIVEFDNLHTYFFTDAGVSKAVDGVTFSIPRGKIVGVVGESGCGKSVTSLSLMRLVQGPVGQIVEGSIRFKTKTYETDEKGDPIPIWETDENGDVVMAPEKDKKGNEKRDKQGNAILKPVQMLDESGLPAFRLKDIVYDIAKMPTSKMTSIRGKEIAMIFQEPMTSLNPVFTIGFQLDEMVLLHIKNINKAFAKQYSIRMLEKVGISMPERVYKSYPHELSGGMRQRVMIAMALSCNPKLIIADEPTTALDVTIQAQVLDLLKEVKDKIDGSIMLITHDLGVIAEMADYIVIMYAGRIIEQGTAFDIFDNPLHPYTVGLQKSKPVINGSRERLYSIPGQVPNPINMPDYCYFKDRCNRCIGACDGKYPKTVQVTPTHSVACYLYSGEEEDNGTN